MRPHENQNRNTKRLFFSSWCLSRFPLLPSPAFLSRCVDACCRMAVGGSYLVSFEFDQLLLPTTQWEPSWNNPLPSLAPGIPHLACGFPLLRFGVPPSCGLAPLSQRALWLWSFSLQTVWARPRIFAHPCSLQKSEFVCFALHDT